MIRIAIIDDHAIVRAGLRQILLRAGRSHGRRRGRQRAGSGRHRRARDRSTSWSWTCRCPTRAASTRWRRSRRGRRICQVLILSAFPRSTTRRPCCARGASGYLEQGLRPGGDRQGDPHRVTAAASTSPLALPSCSPTAWRGSASKPPHEQLSEREFQVFLRLGQGRDHRPHGRQHVAEREDGEHVPDPGDGEDEAANRTAT